MSEYSYGLDAVRSETCKIQTLNFCFCYLTDKMHLSVTAPRSYPGQALNLILCLSILYREGNFHNTRRYCENYYSKHLHSESFLSSHFVNAILPSSDNLRHFK